MTMSAKQQAVDLASPSMLPPALAAAASKLARWRYPLLALVALLQAAVLFYMVADRENLLANGRMIDLKVIPVDPRDLFRGDYVTLSFDMSRIPRRLVAGDLRRGDAIYVVLSEQDGAWKPVSAGREQDAAPPSAGGVTLKARVRYASRSVAASDTSLIAVSYGIEKFFVPEGAGREIEKDVRSKQVIAHVAVAADGTAALKGLTVAGVRHDMPPLF